MKSGRGRRFIKRILEIFFHSPRAQKRSDLPCYRPSLRKEVEASEGQDENPPEYSYSKDHCRKEHALLSLPSRRDLENEIIQVWKTVYLGLYGINNFDYLPKGCHCDHIEALYYGAGLKDRSRIDSFSTHMRLPYYGVANGGLASLQLCHDTPISTLRSVLDLLKIYESEIVNLQRLYSLLRKRQLDLHDLMDTNPTHIADTERDYLAIAEPMVKRLKTYDIRLNVLNHEIRHDTIGLPSYNRGNQREQFVFCKVFHK